MFGVVIQPILCVFIFWGLSGSPSKIPVSELMCFCWFASVDIDSFTKTMWHCFVWLPKISWLPKIQIEKLGVHSPVILTPDMDKVSTSVLNWKKTLQIQWHISDLYRFTGAVFSKSWSCLEGSNDFVVKHMSTFKGPTWWTCRSCC